jgi:hypothetical protein
MLLGHHLSRYISIKKLDDVIAFTKLMAKVT